ncbi:MAG TPA: CocE/NonD family hydrolase, partial [Puia sp.]|nr:CocE/NonD family hydrolase [Puia sp.]
MRNNFYAILALFLMFVQQIAAQADSSLIYKKNTVMIPMRDGVKLYTVIVSPVTSHTPLPILIERTPYGADIRTVNDSAFTIPRFFPFYNMAKEG